MPLLRGISELVTCASPDGQDDVGPVADAALVWREGVVVWAGPEADLPAGHADGPAFDAGGRLVVPGLIDCHTHLAFGGWRADEFTRRIRGDSYREIARAGGGIASTVRETRRLVARGGERLYRRARGFADAMLRLGVTAIECKSGYGLDPETEIAQLEAYARLAAEGPQRIVATFLGAHVVPPEHRSDPEAYLELLVDRMIPAVADAGLAEFCDVFVEEGAFSAEHARRILGAAASRGLRPKLHVDQLGDGGGAALAAELDAVSADHLEFASAEGIEAMSRAGTVGVTLPIATLYLNQDPPPAREMIEAGVPVAVATDFNPGTAPSFDLRLAMLLACTRQRMTPAEVLKGVTRHAARAIGREDEIGSLEPGKAADFVLLDAPDLEHWFYHHRPDPAIATVIGGQTRSGSLGA